MPDEKPEVEPEQPRQEQPSTQGTPSTQTPIFDELLAERTSSAQGDR